MAKTMVMKKEILLNSSVQAPVGVHQGQEFYRPKQVAELLGISMRTYLLYNEGIHWSEAGARGQRHSEGCAFVSLYFQSTVLCHYGELGL